MVRQLQKVGDSKGLILTRVMLEHLGAEDAVDVTLEAGKITITAPAMGASIPARRPRKRLSPEEAASRTFEQHDEALRKLSQT